MISETTNKQNLKTVLSKYIPEVIVIFIGISISFWFDEWRDNRKDRETERKILINLKENLSQDTLMLAGSANLGNNLVRGINKLIFFKKDAEIADSLDQFIDMAASYSVISSNQTTYEEIKQIGHTSLIQDDTLKKAILGHYTVLMPYCKEWCEIDKMQTMTQLIPEMSNYFPVVIDSTNMVPISQKLKALKFQKLRNLLLTNLTYKKEAIKALGYTKDNSKRIIKRIDKALSK